MNNNIFDIARITRMYALTAQIKDMTKERDAIKKPISDYMKDNGIDTKTVGQYRFIVSTYEKETVDVEKLKALYPEAYAECVATNEIKSFSMK